MKNNLLWIALVLVILIIGLAGAAIPLSSSRILSNQDGLFFWSSSTNTYLRVSTVVDSMQINHNNLFRKIHELEIRVKVLEEN